MEPDEESSNKEATPAERRKAERTIWILYAVMAVFILLPFLFLLFR